MNDLNRNLLKLIGIKINDSLIVNKVFGVI